MLKKITKEKQHFQICVAKKKPKGSASVIFAKVKIVGKDNFFPDLYSIQSSNDLDYSSSEYDSSFSVSNNFTPDIDTKNVVNRMIVDSDLRDIINTIPKLGISHIFSYKYQVEVSNMMEAPHKKIILSFISL